MKNFKSPYFASSIREFWSRWHISLSTWFRDYVYIPLGGNRKGKARRNVNTILTFVLSGLWHGANMTFVLWGLLHGFAQVVENIIGIKEGKKKNIVYYIRIVFVFIFCSLAWVLFRANSMEEAKYIYSNMLNGVSTGHSYLTTAIRQLGMGRMNLLFCTFTIFLLCIHDYFEVKYTGNIESYIDKFPKLIRVGIYYILVVVSIFAYIQNAGSNQFVYFQF